MRTKSTRSRESFSETCLNCGILITKPDNWCYCSKACYTAHAQGPRSPRWRTGYSFTNRGYKRLHLAGRKVLEHVYVVEQAIGRRLTDEEQVHHVNGVKDDNRPENLQLVTKAEHRAIHAALSGWSRAHAACVGCGTTDRPHHAQGCCRPCYLLAYPRQLARWSKRHACCVQCGTTDSGHRAHGLCGRCYTSPHR